MASRNVRTLSWPDGLLMRVLWTGVPASTGLKLEKLAAQTVRPSRSALGLAAAQMADAWRSGDTDRILSEYLAYIGVLRQFSVDHDLGIFDAGHEELTDAAMVSNLVYKPAGAGGGDIGVLFGRDEAEFDAFVAKYADRIHGVVSCEPGSGRCAPGAGMRDSRIAGLYRLSIPERIARLEELGCLSAADAARLRDGRHVLASAAADRMIENVVGVFGLPFAIAPNFVVNGREHVVPLVVEEPSIVAGLSSAAAMARPAGGFEVENESSLLIGQVHVTGVGDADHAIAAIGDAKAGLLDAANAVHPRLTERGGGVRDIEVRLFALPDGKPLIAVHVLVDTCDAMGANLVNTICEAVAPDIAALCEGQVALRILSNLADRSLFTARVRYALPDDVRDAIVMASDIASVDPYRATTHNKGVMNGVDALAIATGNDWRAIEAGAHAYAAAMGRYQSLTRWSTADNGDLVGELKMPLKVGTVGGTLANNPAARLGLALAGTDNARELAELMAAVGLAQNFAALRALATSGIQAGHMKLHARSVAASAGTPDDMFDAVVERMIESGEIKDWKAREILGAMQGSDAVAPTASAAGKVILVGRAWGCVWPPCAGIAHSGRRQCFDLCSRSAVS